MKSTAADVGGVNLKGRKTRRLRCGCCTAIDLRGTYKEKQDNKYIHRYMKEFRYEPREESYS